jgi:hypothetical protein
MVSGVSVQVSVNRKQRQMKEYSLRIVFCHLFSVLDSAAFDLSNSALSSLPEGSDQM